MRIPCLRLLAALPLIFAPVGFAASPISVADAWARATPPGATTAAAYLTVSNAGTAADRLVGGSSPAARQLQMHAEVVENGMQHMRQLEGVDVPAKAKVEFGPGAMHLMLVGIGAPLVPGSTISLTLHFEKAGDVTVDVPVRDGRAAPEHHHH